ncbi:MAG: hypothetical protein JNM56_06060 [Planctomycetia bacterium]|nr:hypothetical protein [Planctomycetia bacterium]
MYWFARVFRHHVGAKHAHPTQNGDRASCMTPAELAEIYRVKPAGVDAAGSADLPSATPVLVSPKHVSAGPQ